MADKINNAELAIAFPSANPLLAGLTIISLVVIALTVGYSVYAGFITMALLSGISFVAVLLAGIVAARSRKTVTSGEIGENIIWENSPPSVQRRSLDLEVAELSKILEVDDSNLNDLRTAYIIAEDLAMRQLQREENVPMMRKVMVCGVPFDVAYLKEKKVVCGDATFLLVPDIRQEKVDAMMSKAAAVAAELKSSGSALKIRLIMVLITQLTPEDSEILRKNLDKSRFSSTQVDIDIRTLDFEELQRIFETDGDPL